MTLPLRKQYLSQYPSEAILQALEDMEVVEKTPGYEIDMAAYYQIPSDRQVCQVCLGGAVLLRTYSDYKGLNYYNNHDNVSVAKSFDELRSGNIWHFLEYWIDERELLLLKYPERHDYHEMRRDVNGLQGKHISYEESPKGFKQWLRDVSAVLDKHGY